MSSLSSVSPGVSQREFARQEGCDPKLIQRAVKAGHLPTLSDGKLDPALVKTGWRKANRRAADAGDTSADSPHPVLTRYSPKPRDTEPRDPEPGDDAGDVIDTEQFLAEVLSGKVHKLADSERVKEGALAAKQVIAARLAAGQVVELQVAETVLFNAARAARDSWLNWPSRVGPLIAADLDLAADRVTEVLTAHVQSHLAELGEPEADFRPDAG